VFFHHKKIYKKVELKTKKARVKLTQAFEIKWLKLIA